MQIKSCPIDQGSWIFAIGLVNSDLNLPDRQVKFFGGIQVTAIPSDKLLKFVIGSCGSKAVF